ncbi:MAG: DUF2232 domain-containing protein [Syntrophomonas sp.]
MVIFALVSLMACLAMAYLPALTFVLAIAWGISLIIGSLYLTKNQIAVIWGLNILLLYGLTGNNSMFFYFSFFGLPFMVMSFLAAEEDKGYYYILKRGIMASLIGVSLFMGFIYLTTGGVGIGQLEKQLDNYFEESWQQYEKSGAVEFYEQKGITNEEIKTQVKDFAHSIARHLPAFFYLESISVVFLVLYLSSYLSRKRQIMRLMKKPFTREIMPWQGAWVVIAGLVLWLWGRDNNSVLYLTGSNILLLCTAITIYFGLSALTYKIKQLKPSTRKVTILILIVLSVMFTISAIIFLALLGLFDSLIDYRKLRSQKEEEQE